MLATALPWHAAVPVLQADRSALGPSAVTTGLVAWSLAVGAVAVAWAAAGLLVRPAPATRAAAVGAGVVAMLLVALAVLTFGVAWLPEALLCLAPAGVAAGAWAGLGWAAFASAPSVACPVRVARAIYVGADAGAAASLPAVALTVFAGQLERIPAALLFGAVLLVCGGGTGAALGALWWPLREAFEGAEIER